MRTQTFGVLRTIDAPAHEVWSLLAAVDSWPRWAPLDSAARDRTDHGSENVGNEWRLRIGRHVARTRVVGHHATRRLSLELLSGVPLREMRVEITLRPRRNGTEAFATADLRTEIAGFVIRRQVQDFLSELIIRLAARAEDPPIMRTEAAAPARLRANSSDYDLVA